MSAEMSLALRLTGLLAILGALVYAFADTLLLAAKANLSDYPTCLSAFLRPGNCHAVVKRKERVACMKQKWLIPNGWRHYGEAIGKHKKVRDA